MTQHGLLEFAIAGFDFPAAPIARSQCVRLETPTIQQGGQENARFSVGGDHPHGPGSPVLGQFGRFGAGLRGYPQADQAIVGIPGEHVPLRVRFGRDQVVTFLTTQRQPQQNFGTEKAPVEDGERMIDNAPDQRLGVQHLVLAVGAKGDIRNQMRGDGRDADRSYLWVTGHFAARVRLGAEVRPVVGTVGRAKRRAIHGPQ